MSMPVIHSRKIIEITRIGRFEDREIGSSDGFVRAVRNMDMVGFAFGSTHPCMLCLESTR
jgi:hypothetical protein